MSRRASVLAKIKKQRAAKQRRERAERIAEMERQQVVVVQPLVRRRVDLDPIAHSEQPLGPGPLPNQGIERGQQRSRPETNGGLALGVRRAWQIAAMDRGEAMGLDQHYAAAVARRARLARTPWLTGGQYYVQRQDKDCGPNAYVARHHDGAGPSTVGALRR